MKKRKDAFDKMFFSKYIGNILSEKRKKLRVTVSELGKSLGIGHSHVVNVLNGKTMGNLELLKNISKELDITDSSFDELVKEAKREEYKHYHSKDINEIPPTIENALKEIGINDTDIIDDIKKYIQFRKETNK